MTQRSAARSSRGVLVDLSNIATGGALQVAASVFDELGRTLDDPSRLRRWPWLSDAVVEASPYVLANSTYRAAGLNVREVDGSPISKVRQRRRSVEFDVSFMLFGPDYGARRARTSIVGFADVTSLYPEFANIEGLRAQARLMLRRRVSRARFSHADRIVVEAPHVADELVRRWRLSRGRIDVVPNVLNAVFQAPDGADLGLMPSSLTRFCYPTRLNPHKNVDVLGAVAQSLRERHGRSVEFVLTLTAPEWERLSETTRSASTTVGELRISQLPALYAACDGVIFPSLNECFSVTPLEALASGVPLVASDRSFVRDVAGEAAWYGEPENVDSLADALAGCLSQESERNRRIALGREIAVHWPTAADRTASYLDIIAAARHADQVA